MPRREVIALVAKMPKRPTAKQLAKKYRPYAESLGNLLFAWNNMQEGFGWLFASLTRPENEHIMMAAWYATESDATQRRMLSESAKVVLWHPLLAKQKQDVHWLLREAKELSGTRNDAIHAPLIFKTDKDGTRVEPKANFGNPKAINLAGYDMIALFDWAKLSCDLLRNFAYEAGHYVRSKGAGRTWPDRPALPKRPRRIQTEDAQRR